MTVAEAGMEEWWRGWWGGEDGGVVVAVAVWWRRDELRTLTLLILLDNYVVHFFIKLSKLGVNVQTIIINTITG